MENMKNQAVNDEELEQVAGGASLQAVDDPIQGADAAAVFANYLANLDVFALDSEVANSVFALMNTTKEKYLSMSAEEKRAALRAVPLARLYTMFGNAAHAIKENT